MRSKLKAFTWEAGSSPVSVFWVVVFLGLQRCLYGSHEDLQKHQDELLACAREWTFQAIKVREIRRFQVING